MSFLTIRVTLHGGGGCVCPPHLSAPYSLTILLLSMKTISFSFVEQ